MDRGTLETALVRCHGQLGAVARALDISVLEVRRWIQKLGLDTWPAQLQDRKRCDDLWRRARRLAQFAKLEERPRCGRDAAEASALLGQVEHAVLERTRVSARTDLRYPSGRRLVAARLAVLLGISPEKALRQVEQRT